MPVGRGSLQGYKTVIGIAEESTWGTRLTATAFMEFSSESMNRVDEEILPESLNTDRAHQRRLRGNTVVTGSIEGMLNVGEDMVVMLIANALGGGVSSTAISAGASYTHSLSAGDIISGDVPSFSLTKAYTGTTIQQYYAGCRVNSLTLKVEQGDVSMITAEIVGKYASSSTDSITSVITDVTPCFFPHCYFYQGNTIASIVASANVMDIQSMEITINNNLITDTPARALGSREIGVLVAGKREVTVKTMLRFDTSTAYDLSRGDSSVSLGLLFDSGQTIGGVGSSTYSMLVRLPRAYANATEPAVGDAGILQQEVEYTCIRDSSTGYDVETTINNATASY